MDNLTTGLPKPQIDLKKQPSLKCEECGEF